MNLTYHKPCTVEASNLEYDCPPIPRPIGEGKPAEIVPDPYSNFLERTVGGLIVICGIALRE